MSLLQSAYSGGVTGTYAPNASLLGTIGGVLGGVGGFITGGPAGAVAGATAGRQIGDAINGPPGGPPVAAPKPLIGVGTGVTIGGYGVNIGGSFTGPSSGGTATPGTAVACGMKGYHLNKHALGATKKHGALPAHSVYVRNRHMNAGNAHAARRAITRLKSAHRLFKKIDKLIGHHRSTRRAPFRKR